MARLTWDELLLLLVLLLLLLLLLLFESRLKRSFLTKGFLSLTLLTLFLALLKFEGDVACWSSSSVELRLRWRSGDVVPERSKSEGEGGGL
jgi:hypothetical protein